MSTVAFFLYVGMRVNKIVALYEMSRVNVKADTCSTFTFTRDISHIAYFHLGAEIIRAYARENYVTDEIHPYFHLLTSLPLLVSLLYLFKTKVQTSGS